MTAELAEQVEGLVTTEDIDIGGIGGTLAGNALSMAAMASTLLHVLTDDAFAVMTARGAQWTRGVHEQITGTGAPWSVTQLGGRGEYAFSPVPPRNGAAAAATDDFELQQYLHLAALNRGFLLTPFHNMALMCPDTTSADVDGHTAMFAEVVGELFR